MKPIVPLAIAPPDEIRIYSALLDCGNESSRLWHLLRAMDAEGSGRVAVSPKWIAAIMGISKATVYRHLKDAGIWFRELRTVQGGVEVFLNSIYNVCDRLGIFDLGAITSIPVSGLGRAQAKAIATQADAQSKQRQAFWAAKNKKVKNLTKPWEAVASDNSAGANETGKSRFRYVIARKTTIPATSTQNIAKDRWSVSTIRRRLQNQWRSDRGLDPITKARILIPAPPEIAFFVQQSQSRFTVIGNGVYRIMERDRSVFQVGCHIYAEHLDLVSCRFLRSKVKRFLRLPRVSHCVDVSEIQDSGSPDGMNILAHECDKIPTGL
jgi:hypothetical protein